MTVVSAAPALSLVAAGLAATALGCQLDEGSVHPCLLGGVDLGNTLYAGAVLGWLMLVTWPGVLVAMLIWLVILVRVLLWHRAAR